MGRRRLRLQTRSGRDISGRSIGTGKPRRMPKRLGGRNSYAKNVKFARIRSNDNGLRGERLRQRKAGEREVHMC